MVYTWNTCFCNKTWTPVPKFYSKILTFPVKDEGNSASNLLLSPNLQKQNLDCTKIINNPNPCHKWQALHNTLRVCISNSINFRKTLLVIKSNSYNYGNKQIYTIVHRLKSILPIVSSHGSLDAIDSSPKTAKPISNSGKWGKWST